MRTLGRRLVATGAATLVVLGARAPGADAQPPTLHGWWTVTNPSASLPAPPPPPPDVPEGGLLVQGGPQDASDLPGGIGGPSAIAALVHEVPRGEAAERLVLTLAEGAASTPLAPLQACPLTTTTFRPAQGGPMEEAPEYDCSTAVVAEPSDDGATYEWAVGDLERNGVVGVAIVAVGSNDRVVFAEPGDGSLVTVASGDPDEAAPGGSPEVAAPAGGSPSTPAGPTRGVTPAPVPRAPAPAPAAAPAAAPAPAPAPVVPDVAPSFQPTSAVAEEELDGIVAALAVVALAAGATLWALAGRDDPDDVAGAPTAAASG